MFTIWKYPIEITDAQCVTAPEGARWLHAGYDPTGAPCLWAQVDTDAALSEYHIQMYGTGHPCRMDTKYFVGTLITHAFVWHVFVCELIPGEIIDG